MKNTLKTAIVAAAVTTASLGPNITQIFAANTGGPVDDAENTLAQANQTVNSAKQTLDNASQAYQSAQADVNRLTSEKNAADTKLSDANTRLTEAQNEYDSLKEKADSITEEDLTNAQQAVTDATNAADAAQLEADKASEALNNANSIYNDASTKLANAKNAYNQAVEAQQAAEKALEAAQSAEKKADEDAKTAETEKNTAETNANEAAKTAKSAEETYPNAEQNVKNAEESAREADSAQSDAQKDADTAADAKNTAEAEKNTAEADVQSASDDVTNADNDVTDKTTDVTNAENAQKSSEDALADANKTLDTETAKAGDAQAKADQEVKDQQAVVDQKQADKDAADKVLEDAKADQNEKQAALDDANAKLDAAKKEQSEAEKDLKAKQDKLAQAQKTLENAKGDVTSKKKAVDDAQSAVDDAQAKVNNATKEVNDLEASSADKEQALADAKQAVDEAQIARDKAVAELNAVQNSIMYYTIYGVEDPDKPLTSGRTDTFAPVIPEANGAKVTFSPKNYYDPASRNIAGQLNTTGQYKATVTTLYYYPVYQTGRDGKQHLAYYEGYTSVQPDLGDYAYTDNDVDYDGLRPLIATWNDEKGVKHTKEIDLNITSNSIYYNTEQYDKWAESVISSIIKPGMTSKEKAEAITNYVYQNFEYGGHSSGYGMYVDGYGDCWAATDMIIELGSKAGFQGTTHVDNYEPGSGNGHENAWLYSPEDGKYYECEAGFDRKKNPDTGLCDGKGLTWNVTDTGLIMDRTDAKYSGGWFAGGAEEIPGVIGEFTHYGDTEVHVPTDPQYTTLGGRDDGYFSYGPFALYTNLQTVYVGSNITTIRKNAYVDEYNDRFSNGVRWVVDPDNPNYSSDEDGKLYQKNADGTKTLLADPANTTDDRDENEIVRSKSKTNAEYMSEYNDANQKVIDAASKYDSANNTYNNLKKDDFAKAISDAQERQKAAQNLLDAAKTNKNNADNVLAGAEKTASEAEAAVTDADAAVTEAVKKVSKAQEAVGEAQKPVDKAEKSLNDAKSVVSEKQDAVDKAQSAVDDAKKTLDEKKEAAEKGAPQSLLDARKAVEKAKNDLDSKKAALTKANKALENAKKTLNDKQKALTNANEALDTKQKALEKAENTLAEKNTALETAKANAKTAHDNLNKANAAYQAVTDAKAKSTSAEEALKNAQAKLDKANKMLADAKADVEAKNKELADADEKAKDLLEQLGLVQKDADTKKISAEDAKNLYNEKSAALYAGKSTEANAKAALNDLVNTLNRRDELEKEIDDLNEKIPEYESDAENLNTQLDTAKEYASNMETVYKNAKDTYDAIAAAQSKTITYAASEVSVNTDGSMTFKSNADLEKFKGIQIDGKDVDPSQYTVTKGSTVITLKKSYVDTLSKGAHTITIVSEDGSAAMGFELNDKGASIVNNNTPETKNAGTTEAAKTNGTQAYVAGTPDTGDEENSIDWILLEAIALFSAGGAIYLRRRKHAE